MAQVGTPPRLLASWPSMILASPKCWDLHSSWAVPSPIASPDLSPGTLTLLPGARPHFLPTPPLLVVLPLQLSLRLLNGLSRHAAGSSLSYSLWLFHVFKTSTPWIALTYCKVWLLTWDAALALTVTVSVCWVRGNIPRLMIFNIAGLFLITLTLQDQLTRHKFWIQTIEWPPQSSFISETLQAMSPSSASLPTFFSSKLLQSLSFKHSTAFLVPSSNTITNLSVIGVPMTWYKSPPYLGFLLLGQTPWSKATWRERGLFQLTYPIMKYRGCLWSSSCTFTV